MHVDVDDKMYFESNTKRGGILDNESLNKYKNLKYFFYKYISFIYRLIVFQISLSFDSLSKFDTISTVLILTVIDALLSDNENL
jgi:hypothetical protein